MSGVSAELRGEQHPEGRLTDGWTDGQRMTSYRLLLWRGGVRPGLAQGVEGRGLCRGIDNGSKALKEGERAEIRVLILWAGGRLVAICVDKQP